MILDKIIENKKKEIALAEGSAPIDALKARVLRLRRRKPAFAKALARARGVAVIAEIKRRSPSKGLLRKNFDPMRLAKAFEKAGASALSVLTDRRFFGGSTRILQKVRAVTRLPILRKDFILEERQIWESRLIGADAVLLIASVLSAGQLKKLSVCARRAGLDCLYEVHTAQDLKKILELKPRLIGINNRDLRTFHVDLRVTERLAAKIPRGVLIVSESGISSSDDLDVLRASGVRAVLVGEGLMRQKDVGAALKKLLGRSGGTS